MGLGGDLIWTAVLGSLHDHDGRAPIACMLPGLSDVLAGRLYDASVSLRDNKIFRGNPLIAFTDARRKEPWERLLDVVGRGVMKFPSARRRFEDWVFSRSEQVWSVNGERYVHIDSRRHSYASYQTRRRTYWKDGRAVDAMAAPFGIDRVERPPSLCFSAKEESAITQLLAAGGLDGPFIAVEPDTNRDWFGSLRAWPMERWQAVVDHIRDVRPDVPVVQVGLGRSGVLADVVDLTGKTDFRGAALVIRAAALFIGTEGGLMHAARAVEANALILWGGVTLPEFIGYPECQTTICKYVACAPCGNCGWCDQGHRCMQLITVEEVERATLDLLD